MKYFLSTGIVNNIIFGIKKADLDWESMLNEAKISANDLDSPNGFVEAKKVCHLYHLIEESGLTDFGIRLSEQESTGYSVAGYIVTNSPLIEDSLKNAVRYYELVSNVSKLSLEIIQEGAELAWNYRNIGCPIPRSMIDGGIFSASPILEKILGRPHDQVLKAVCFQYDRPNDVSDHERFFKAPLHFGHAKNAIVLDASVLSEPVAGADPALRQLMEQHASGIFAKLPKGSSFLDEFRALLRKNLATGKTDIESVAKSFHMSNKTLQRKLKSENTAFKDQLSQVRQSLAQEYLSKSLSLIDITFLLGYSEQSAFNRAFKSWFNVSPSEYLKTNQG